MTNPNGPLTDECQALHCKLWVVLLVLLGVSLWAPMGPRAEAATVDGLTIPDAHPRIWWTPARIAQAKTWYASHPFTPDSSDDLSLAAHYLITGNVSDCQTVISHALGQTYSDSDLTNAGPDGPRWNGEAAIVAGYDWCYDQLSSSQKSTLISNWNHYLTV